MNASQEASSSVLSGGTTLIPEGALRASVALECRGANVVHANVFNPWKAILLRSNGLVEQTDASVSFAAREVARKSNVCARDHVKGCCSRKATSLAGRGDCQTVSGCVMLAQLLIVDAGCAHTAGSGNVITRTTRCGCSVGRRNAQMERNGAILVCRSAGKMARQPGTKLLKCCGRPWVQPPRNRAWELARRGALASACLHSLI